jgi:hypothetical protein
MDKFTIIATFRNDNNDGTRIANLNWFINYYSQVCDNIVIVEQDKQPMDSELLNKNSKLHNIFVYNAGLFNKAWGYNIGVKYCREHKLPQVYLFCDIDVAIPYKQITTAVELFENNEVVSVNPYMKIWHLNRARTQQFVLTNDYQFLHTENLIQSPTGSVVYAGGAVFMHSNMLLEINGWDEEYRGWGAEDNAMGTVIIRKYGTLRARTLHDGIALHLWHTPPNTHSKMNHSNYLANADRFHNLLKLNVNKFIESRKNEPIANMNKYNTGEY